MRTTLSLFIILSTIALSLASNISLSTLLNLNRFANEIEEDSSSSSAPAPSLLDDYEQAKGFIIGSELMKGKHVCDYEHQHITNDIADIIQILKGPKPANIDDIFDYVLNILKKIQDIDGQARVLIPACESTYKDALDVLTKFNTYTSDPKYQNKVLVHSTLNTFKINKMLNDFKNNYNTRKPYDNGVAGGALSRFIFFWDFKN